MVRSSSRSRSKSPKKMKRQYRKVSKSVSSTHKKHKAKDSKRSKYRFNGPSDIKNHIIFEDIKAYDKKQQEQIISNVKSILKRQFGQIQHISKVDSKQGKKNCFSILVGFKRDKDAVSYINEGGQIISQNGNGKNIVGKPTPIFQYCLPFIQKNRTQTIIFRKDKKPSSQSKSRSSSSSQKKYRKKSPNRSNSRYSDRKQKKRSEDQSSVWIFGLPWSVKGKQVQYFFDKHPSGSYRVLRWKWIRVKNSNCEFMEAIFESRKTEKILNLREQHIVAGYPCIITKPGNSDSIDEVKNILKQYQIKFRFAQKINPGSLYDVLNSHLRVVQMVSTQAMTSNVSSSFVVTFANAWKVAQLKKSNKSYKEVGIEDFEPQLVYRPTKSSKITMAD